MDLRLIIPVVASFLITFLLLPFWIKKAKQIGLVWDDMNKIPRRKVSGSGGLMAVLGFVGGVLLYVTYLVFILGSKNGNLIDIFSMLAVILLLAGIGLIDDLFGWQKGGLSRRSRLILVALSSIPLIAINAGSGNISLPFIGEANLGLLYPLLLIPIGIIGATTTYNFLAGFNGLEAGQGIILLSSLAVVAFFTGNSWLSVISLCMVASLLAFLFFNSYPARTFPGDSLTYSVGGLIAIMAILGNFEKVALFFFIPYIIETILKSRGKLVKYSFGKPLKDGSLDLLYPKIYGLTHVSILFMKKLNIKPTEVKVTVSIWIFQILVVLAGFIIFKNGIFI